MALACWLDPHGATGLPWRSILGRWGLERVLTLTCTQQQGTGNLLPLHRVHAAIGVEASGTWEEGQDPLSWGLRQGHGAPQNLPAQHPLVWLH